MIFTKLGRIVAVLALVLGILTLLMGVSIATGVVGPYDAALARYFGRARSSGAVIDRGIYAILFAIALGILTEISSSVRANRPPE
jgi:hypothetical protein